MLGSADAWWEEELPDLDLHESGRMDCIIEDFLYLGDLESATEESLFHADIWRCVSLLSKFSFKHAPTHLTPQTHLMLEMQDSETQNLEVITRLTTPFLRKAHDEGEKVLVHCSAGISRSVAVVLAYLLEYSDMDLVDAYEYVQQRRPVACPNRGFMQQLKKIKG